MAVDVRHEVFGDEGFPVANGRGGRIHAAAVEREGVGIHDDHFFHGARGDVLVGGIGHLRERHPALGREAVAVQHVGDGIPLVRVCRITRREVDEDVAVGRVAFKISFQGFSVNLDALDGAFLRSCGRRLSEAEV